MTMCSARRQSRMDRSSSAPHSTCMRLERSSHKKDFIMRRAFILVLVLAFNVAAQESQLGRVEFPTSGSKEAQTHFVHGLAALHSFWYEEALEAFRDSTRVDPDFAMGYWGEAMTYN